MGAKLAWIGAGATMSAGLLALGACEAVLGLEDLTDLPADASIADVAFLGLGDAGDTRLEALAHAELEQAHGRLRPVHRTRSGRALHVGSVLPGGYGWTAGPVAVREIGTFSVGRPAVSPEELRELVARVGGVRAAARLIERSPTTVMRYLSGESAVSGETCAALRNALSP